MLIREDLLAELKTEGGRFFVVPEDFMYKLMGATELEEEAEAAVLVSRSGGELVDLETGVMTPTTIKVVRKWRVDAKGNNDAMVELRPADMGGHRFLMRGEPTQEEYILRRAKELGATGREMVPLFGKLSEEYREMTSS